MRDLDHNSKCRPAAEVRCSGSGSVWRVLLLLAGVWLLLGARAEADLWRIEPGCVLDGEGWVAVSRGFSDGGADRFGPGEWQGEASMAAPVSESPWDRPGDERDPSWYSGYEGVLPSGGMGAGGVDAPGSGGGQSALAPAFSQLPQITLIASLPGEGGPAFDNPPPWTPLRPPRSSARRGL